MRIAPAIALCLVCGPLGCANAPRAADEPVAGVSGAPGPVTAPVEGSEPAEGSEATTPASATEPAPVTGAGGPPNSSPAEASDPETTPPEDTAAAGAPAEDGSGQTGSIGASVPCEPDSCAAEAERIAAELRAPAPGSRTYIGGSCQQVSIITTTQVDGPACACNIWGGSFIFIGPEGAGCAAFGRGGDCLYHASEYEACSPGLFDPCPEICAELQARTAADAAAAFDVEVRHSGCYDGSYGCHWVLRIDDACFVDRTFSRGRAVDCALDDDALIDAYLEEQRAQAAAASCPQATCPAPSQRECVERPAGEWQGLRVCSPYPPCDRPDGCGLALACIDGTCGACTRDDQCAFGEGCVLDHCLPLANIGCRSRADCSGDALCILDGYTGGTPRGNERTHSLCLPASGGFP